MQALQQRIYIILQRYLIDPKSIVVASTPLREIGIDVLDLPMIFLDLEDAFGLQFAFDDDAYDVQTAGELVACVVTRLQALRRTPVQPAAPRRPKRSWVSTGAGR